MTQPTASRPVMMRRLHRPGLIARQRNPTEAAPSELPTRIVETPQALPAGFFYAVSKCSSIS